MVTDRIFLSEFDQVMSDLFDFSCFLHIFSQINFFVLKISGMNNIPVFLFVSLLDFSAWDLVGLSLL